VGDERVEVVVVRVGFEAQLVLQGAREGDDEVESGEFGEGVRFAEGGVGVVAFLGVDPDVPG